MDLDSLTHYDLAFSLGGTCACSQSLRAGELQFLSFPFDWLYGGSPLCRARAIVDGPVDWFDSAVLTRHSVPWNLKHESWRNTGNGIVFKHDFAWNVSFEEQLPSVRGKYERRFARLRELIGRSGSVLAVWITPPELDDFPNSEFTGILELLRGRWPDVRFELLKLSCERGRAFKDRLETSRDGFRTVAFDYFDGRTGFYDTVRMAKFLKSVISVTDYRSERERREWPARQRQLRYGVYRADNWLDYMYNRMLYRLYRHVRKQIVRRGLQCLG